MTTNPNQKINDAIRRAAGRAPQSDETPTPQTVGYGSADGGAGHAEPRLERNPFMNRILRQMEEEAKQR